MLRLYASTKINIPEKADAALCHIPVCNVLCMQSQQKLGTSQQLALCEAAALPMQVLCLRNLQGFTCTWVTCIWHVSDCTLCCCLQDNVAAALAMQTAHGLDPACQQHTEDLERLLRRVPLAVADILEVQYCFAHDITQSETRIGFTC